MDPPSSGTEGMQKVVQQAAIHRASTVAASTKQAQKATSSSSFSKLAREVMDLQRQALDAQLALLQELEQLNDDQKLETLFTLLDKNHNGQLSVVELADGLRKIRGDVDLEASLVLAMERVQQFDKNGDAQLSLQEFKSLATTICEALGASFHELSEMLIWAVVFSSRGNSNVENLIVAMAEEDITKAVQEESVFRYVMKDERMKALFHLFDVDGNHQINFPEVVLGLYQIAHDLEDAAAGAVAALLLFDDDASSTLNYPQFAKFILQVMQAMGTTFDQAILSMTLAVAQPSNLTPEDIMAKIRAMAVEDMAVP